MAVVRVLDSSGNVASSASVSLSPGQRTNVTLSVVLPQASGNYQWRIIAINSATGNQDDEKTVQVSVVTYLPVFRIVSYNSSIAGPVGSRQRLVVTVQNTGNAAGNAVLTVIDNNGNAVSSTTLSIPAGQTATATLTVTLPSSRGTYTWRINVTNQATGKIDDTKTLLVTVKDIYLQSRCALIYTPFESLPSGWSSIGGLWSIAPGYGVGGTSALKGVDNDAGPGRDSVYYWQRSVSSYANLYALVQVTNVNGNDRIYVGYGLLESASSSSRLYEVSLYTWGQSVRLNIYLWTQLSWISLNYIDVRYSGTTYALFLNFSRSGTSNSISATLYDQSGNALGSTSAIDSSFGVNYFGLIVDGGTGYFDNLVVSSMCDPRYVQVNGLNPGWTAELRDSSGNLVSSAAADSSGTATFSVVKLPVVLNGSIVIKDQYGNVVIQKTFSDIVGGDTYTYG